MSPATVETGTTGLRSTEDYPKDVTERLLPGCDLSGQKRKAPEKKQNRFKVVAQLVMAMQRFQASLNPTYTYGKRPSSSGSVERKVVDSGEAAVTSSLGNALPRSASPAGSKGERRTTETFKDRGHKTDLIFRPLPRPEAGQESHED